MNWIDEYVAVGGWIDATFVENLQKHGIELIIDARTLFDKIYGDDKKPLVDKVMKAGEMLVMLSEHDCQVLVRCRDGVDRTPFIAMIYVSKKYGMSYKEAYELVKQKRPQTVFHWDWVKMLPP